MWPDCCSSLLKPEVLAKDLLISLATFKLTNKSKAALINGIWSQLDGFCSCLAYNEHLNVEPLRIPSSLLFKYNGDRLSKQNPCPFSPFSTGSAHVNTQLSRDTRTPLGTICADSHNQPMACCQPPTPNISLMAPVCFVAWRLSSLKPLHALSLGCFKEVRPEENSICFHSLSIAPCAKKTKKEKRGPLVFYACQSPANPRVPF